MVTDSVDSSRKSPRVSARAQAVPWSPIRNMMALAAKIPDVINFSVGQPDFETPEHIVEAGRMALSSGHTHYGPVLGISELRQAVARKLDVANGIKADPDSQVIITVGAQEAITLALLTLLDPGDEVIMPDPIYANYHGHVPMVSARKVLVPAREDNGFMMTADDIEAAITDKTRLIMINSPTNPTGAVASQSVLESYARVAKEHDLLVISDEAYEVLIYDDAEHISIASLPGMAERTVSIYTFSKTYAMTGWRIGYLTGPLDLVNEMHKLQEEVVSCPVTFAQYGALAALEGPQDCVVAMVAEYAERRHFMLEALRGFEGISFFEPKGAFYVFVNVTSLGMDVSKIALSLLENASVATVPGSAFGLEGEGFLRLCYGSTPIDTLEVGLERLRKGLKALS